MHGTYNINKLIKGAKFNKSAPNDHSQNFTNALFIFCE